MVYTMTERDMCSCFSTYVAEEVLEVVASGVVVCIQNSGVHVLLLMISLPVVQLSMAIGYNYCTHLGIKTQTVNMLILKVQLTHLAGPGVTQDSSHIDRGVCHDGVIVVFFLGLLSVFKLKGENMTNDHRLMN